MIQTTKPSATFRLFALTCGGFVSLGLADGMLGVAWPSMRAQYGLTLDAIGYVLVMSTVGYLVASFGGGGFLTRVRLGVWVGTSILLSGLSLLAYAAAPTWSVIVVAAAFAGLGAGAVDTGLNSHAALHHRPGTVNWLHAAYGLGAAISPFLQGQLLARGGSWKTGYAVIGGVNLVLALCFLITWRSWPVIRRPSDRGDTSQSTLLESLRIKTVAPGIGAFFVYTGLEAAVGTWGFSLLTTRHNLGAGTAGAWMSAYWMSLGGGRILAGVLAFRIQPKILLQASAAGLVGGSALVLANADVPCDLAGILLLGLACAAVFPLLIALTPERVGSEHATRVVGFQIAAGTLGQSLVPTGIGIAAQRHGITMIPWLWFADAVLLCFLLRVILPRRARTENRS